MALPWLDRSLARRMAALVAVLLLLATGIQSGLSYHQVRKVLRQEAEIRLRGIARQMEGMLSRPISETTSRLEHLAGNPAISAVLAPGATAQQKAAASALLQATILPGRSALALLDSSGGVVLQLGPPGRPAWYGPAAEPAPGGVAVTPYRRLNDSTAFLDVQVPVKSGARVLGTLVQRNPAALSRQAPATLAALMGGSSRLVIGSPATNVWFDLGRFLSPPPAGALRPDTLSQFSWDGTEYLGVAHPMSGTGQVLLVQAPRAAVLAPADHYLKRALLVAGLTILLGGLGAVLIGSWLNRPLERVTEVASAIAAGDMGRRADQNAPGEVGRLARSFNTMMDQVTHSDARYRILAENARDIVTLQQFDGTLLYVSPSAATLGYQPEDVVGTRVDLLVHPEDLAGVQRAREEAMRGDTAGATCTYRVRRKDGDWTWLEVIYRRTVLPEENQQGLLCAARDVTQRKRLEAQFLQAQKLEAIGRLAGGVAHDFNNLLTAIVGGADAVQELLPPGHPGAPYLEEIHLTARRAATLTRQLLTFARHQVVQVQSLDLNGVLGSLDSMIRRIIGEDIQMVTKTAERLPPVRADEGQLGQVLLNLVVNARDAMPSGGRLTVETRAVELDAEYARQHAGVTPGRYVLLAVSDTGTGIPPEIAAHLFEPFFTTKPVGRGTGLGLATCFGIVTAAGGHLWYYTEQGIGTTFKVYLPQAEYPADLAPEPDTTAEPAGTERVLVVEDEPAVRRVTVRMLQSLGYRVQEAASGPAAIRLLEQAGELPELVVTDMVMPEMSGSELIATLREENGKVRVLFLSGYTEEALANNGTLESGLHFLQKPFSRQELARAVRGALSS
ncbi:MAG TPA: response regulator [Gemmatimonadales bacterium]|nr:response regulator [Gemmatimonadales bacterium]